MQSLIDNSKTFRDKHSEIENKRKEIIELASIQQKMD